VDESLVVSIPEAARLLRISERSAYEMARTGRLGAIRLGVKRWVVPRKALERLIEEAATKT
jgi:excisionase family DNA binding protein